MISETNNSKVFTRTITWLYVQVYLKEYYKIEDHRTKVNSIIRRISES